MAEKKKTQLLEPMPMIALRGMVLFPNMVLHLEIGRKKSLTALEQAMKLDRRVFFAAQKSGMDADPNVEDLYDIGVVGEIKQVVKIPSGGVRVMVEGLYRAKATEILYSKEVLLATVKKYVMKKAGIEPDAIDGSVRVVRDQFVRYVELSPKMPKELTEGIFKNDDPTYVAEYVAANLPLAISAKQDVLEADYPMQQLATLAVILEYEINILGYEQDLYEHVKQHMDKNQREYYLREQMKVIADELNEGDSPLDEAENYKEKIAELPIDEEYKKKLVKETKRLSKMSQMSQEAAVIRGYLDTCLELPWDKQTAEVYDVKLAEKVLNKDHFGLEKIKERIVEHIAVKAMSKDVKSQILCFVGPPGVGKTSIARSIAEATGRAYVRMSLGGVRDEAEIRGHRKTYVGSMPGRIMSAMKQAGSNNPLMLLDEIDKLGADHKGDPSSALLEVLDGEQNHSFRDHFIEIPFDLSNVMFIATANNKATIPGPLLDRMEVIELGSYTREEKKNIAKLHLIPKQLKNHGLAKSNTKIDDSAIYAIIDSYTREAGVRKLERVVSTLCRKSAKLIASGEKTKVTINAKNIKEFLGSPKYRNEGISKVDEIGVVNGLAWTSVGGEMLTVEVAVMEGTGKLSLTGSLGDVMKESANGAITYIRSKSEELQIAADFYKTKDIHIHFPEGAVPKDGPSAGIAITTAVVSALTMRAVHRDVAMTGEVTIRGRVLAIGGLKEKSMAAYRSGVKRVFIPRDNLADLDDVADIVKDNITFIPVDHVSEVLSECLAQKKAEKKASRKKNVDSSISKVPLANETAIKVEEAE